MKKTYIALILFVFALNLEAENLEEYRPNSNANLKTPSIQHKASLIETLKDNPSISNEHLTEILQKRQDNIAHHYKEAYTLSQKVHNQFMYLIIAISAIGIANFANMCYVIGRRLNHYKRQNVLITKHPHSPFIGLLEAERKTNNVVDYVSAVILIAFVATAAWGGYLYSTLSAIDSDKQKLNEEHVFLAEEIRLLQDEKQGSKSSVLESKVNG